MSTEVLSFQLTPENVKGQLWVSETVR